MSRIVIPQQPENLPPPYTGPRAEKIYADDIEQLALPEGYFPLQVMVGMTQKWMAPTDNRGNFRKPLEAWWETTWIDGKIVPIVCFMGRFGPSSIRPKEWKKRKLCSAWDEKIIGGFCTEPKRECKYNHCGGWHRGRGYGCPRKRANKLSACRAHFPKKRTLQKAIERKTFDKLQNSNIYRECLDKGSKALFDRLNNENLYSFDDELKILKVEYQKAIIGARYGETESAWLKLKDAWNSFASAKSEKSVESALEEIGKLIQSGVDQVARLKETRESAKTIAQIVKTKEDIVANRERNITADQLLAMTTTFYSLVRDVWGRDPANLLVFQRRFMEAITPSFKELQIEVLPDDEIS
jgi:hypothetical protein